MYCQYTMAKESTKQIINLQGKVAIITGSSSGIGAGIAVLFAKLGAKVTLHGRQHDNLKKVADECEKHGGKKPLLVLGDVTDSSVLEMLVNKTVEHFGHLDILVNNAASMEMGSIENTSMEQFDRMININLRSVYQLTMLAVPHLIKSKGSVVNISAIAGNRSFPGMLAYGTSKAALDQFTRCVALELAPKQVRVNSVNPGIIETNLLTRHGLPTDNYKQMLSTTLKEMHPLQRIGTVEEIADAVAFLASESSSFITGVQLPVDGGIHAKCGATASSSATH